MIASGNGQTQPLRRAGRQAHNQNGHTRLSKAAAASITDGGHLDDCRIEAFVMPPLIRLGGFRGGCVMNRIASL